MGRGNLCALLGRTLGTVNRAGKRALLMTRLILAPEVTVILPLHYTLCPKVKELLSGSSNVNSF